MTKGILLLAIAFSTASVALAAPLGAELHVRQMLAQSGINRGVDATTGRYVFIGTCERNVADPAASKTFLRLRAECAAVAELSAKRDILVAFRPTYSGEDADAVQSGASGASRITTSIFKTLASEKLEGASVVCSAESWDAATGLYQVAVAVAWTKKLVAAAVDATPPPAPVSEEEDQAEWDRWLEGINLSIALGMRQFVDSRGLRRFAGIGCADVEGKTGAARNAARIVAETNAKASLALGLYGDTEMCSIAKTEMVEQASASGELSVDVWETFVGKVRAQCRNKQLRGRVVRQEEVVHPVTGRHMLVCVFGMTAADQAEMNRINSGNP